MLKHPNPKLPQPKATIMHDEGDGNMKISLKWWRCCKTKNENDKVRSYTNKTLLLGQTIGAVEMARICLFLVVNKQEKEKKDKVLVLVWMRVIFGVCHGWR